MLLTEATRRRLGSANAARLEPHGRLPLKGKADPVPLYAARVLDGRSREGAERLTAEA